MSLPKINTYKLGIFAQDFDNLWISSHNTFLILPKRK